MDSPRLTVSEVLLNSNSSNGFLADNIWHPIANTLVVEPHNAVTSSVNDVSKLVGGGELLKDWKPYHIPQAEVGSKAWLAQNVSSGAAMVVPYGIAALCARGTLRSVGARWGAEGATANFLNSRATATIMGGTVYDFLKKPHNEKETRLGNAMGATVGFSVFESGNFLSKGQTGVKLVAMRALTGSLGAMSQQSVSRFIATGEAPQKAELWNAALTGATMNNLLPAFHDKLTDMSNQVSVARGKGMPVDDYIKAQGKQLSPELNTLAAENPWARVQPGEHPAQTRHGSRLIELPQTGDNLPKLGHELAHLSRNKAVEPIFEQAKKLLAEGKNEEAQALYLEARAQQETAALAAERQVAADLGRPVTDATFDPAQSKTPSGKTYREVWLAEFEKFKETNGLFRPEMDYRPRTNYAEADWSHIARNLDRLPAERKAEVARNLQHAPESAARQIFASLLKDADPAVRAEAVRNIGLLPANSRAKAWYEAFGRTEPELKSIAVDVIGQLPAAERYAAWNHAFSQLRTLPAESGATGLVKAIEQLPARDRYTAWEKALQTSETSRLAAENLAVLPESNRTAAWNMLQRQGKAGADTLMKQVADLPISDRASAFSTLIRESRSASGEATKAALASLPEGVRFEHWRKLLTSTEPGEQSPVFDALSAISDPRIRSAAWHEAFSKIGTANAESAAKAIPDLPPQTRAAALLRAMAEAPPNNEFKGALASIPGADIAQVQRGIANMPPSEVRAAMAQSLPIYKLGELPVGERINTLKSIFGEAEKHPEVFSPQALRHWWWHLLPEQRSTDPTALVSEAPVREALSSSLSEKQLASIVFAEDPVLADRMASAHSDAVRAVARNFSPQSEASLAQMRSTAARYIETGSLIEATKTALASDALAIDPPAADLLGGLSRESGKPAIRDTLALLSQQTRDGSSSPSKVNLAIKIAAAMRAADPHLFNTSFLKPLEETIADHTVHPQRRFALAFEIARLAREGRLGDASVALPSARTEVRAKLPQNEQAAMRSAAEAAMSDAAGMKAFIESGKLADVFPEIFDKNPALAERMARLTNEMHSNPEFAKLPAVDQVNLIWATLIHEGAANKQPAGQHVSWGTAADAYGVLKALGYPPERVQRIATLISRHTELAPVEGNPVLTDPTRAIELGLVYRHPEALRQIGILNQAKLAIEGTSSTQTGPRVKEINAAIEAAQAQLGLQQIPLLLSELPKGFGFEALPGNWRVLGHTSPYITSSFMQQLALMESPHYAMSTSLLTPKHLHLYNPEARLVALVTAPAENVVTAARSSFTGTNVDFARVVRDSAALAEKNGPVAQEVNAALARLADTTPGAPRNLAELNRALAQTSNLAGLPEGSPLRKAAEAVHKAMCTQDGKPLNGHNEAKVVNPTLTGIGIVRGGRPVVLQGVSDPAVIAALMGGKQPPAWVRMAAAGTDAIVIPEHLWREMARRNTPFITLD